MLWLVLRRLEISEVMLIARASEPPSWNLHDTFCCLSMTHIYLLWMMEIANFECFEVLPMASYVILN